MGSSATEDVVESPSNPQEASISARSEPATKVSKERERLAVDEPARSKNAVVDASDEIGWVSPKSQKASRPETSRQDSASKEVVSREPTSRELSDSGNLQLEILLVSHPRLRAEAPRVDEVNPIVAILVVETPPAPTIRTLEHRVPETPIAKQSSQRPLARRSEKRIGRSTEQATPTKLLGYCSRARS